MRAKFSFADVLRRRIGRKAPDQCPHFQRSLEKLTSWRAMLVDLHDSAIKGQRTATLQLG